MSAPREHTALAPFPYPATTTCPVTIANTIATRGITGITRTTATHVKVAAKKKNITKEKQRAAKKKGKRKAYKEASVEKYNKK